jgi:autotransporter-associated beta strand protein
VAADGPYAWGTTSGSNYYAGAGLNAYFGGTDGTVTVTGTVQAHNGLTIVTGDYSFVTGTINLAGSSAAANTINATTGTTIVSATLSGSNGLTKDGGGILRLDAANTGLSGGITINDGTLRANATNAVALSGSDRAIINSGGSLLITASNAVSGNITLDGGTIAISGTTNDTVGALTLNSNSVIDLASLTGNLTFADSSAISWDGTLSIWNWNGTNLYGTSYGDNTRHVYFGNSASGLTESQLNNISFYSDSGSSFIGNAFMLSTGEIIAVPEPGVYATAALLLLGLAFQAWRRHTALVIQRR